MNVAKPPVYNSLWQLRADSWSALEEASERLAVAVGARASLRTAGQRSDQPARCARADGGLLGLSRNADLPARAAAVRGREIRPPRAADRQDQPRVDHGFLSQRRAVVGRAPGPGTAEQRDCAEPGDHRETRPYFEVLVVEDMTEPQERALREELRQLAPARRRVHLRDRRRAQLRGRADRRADQLQHAGVRDQAAVRPSLAARICPPLGTSSTTARPTT